MKTVLSIDGGGIRGLIPAVILAKLEEALAARGLPTALEHHFDLICGTSTGGIIAAGLTTPHPAGGDRAAFNAADLVALYKDNGAEIFARPWWRALTSVVRRAAYDPTTLETMLKDRLGHARLRDARTRVTLTAYDIDARRAVFMSNTEHDPEDYAVWEAARATAAAPTFFPPAQVRPLRHGEPITRTLVDGGVFANDPVFSAFVEARKNDFAAGDIHILSLGTGVATRSYPYREARNWGLIDWLRPSNATPIISILMHGQASSAAYLADRLLNDADAPRYERIDMPLTAPAKDDLDDTSPENLRALEQVALGALETEDGRRALERVVSWLEWRGGGG
ncbi:MAG: phospholipase [Alphaproteobacteria bacterium]|jgi:patatin-like phospholipase/acyl hydrolase|nr:phospholipase [Alphaproteobacteria bacterium]